MDFIASLGILWISWDVVRFCGFHWIPYESMDFIAFHRIQWISLDTIGFYGFHWTPKIL